MAVEGESFIITATVQSLSVLLSVNLSQYIGVVYF